MVDIPAILARVDKITREILLIRLISATFFTQ